MACTSLTIVSWVNIKPRDHNGGCYLLPIKDDIHPTPDMIVVPAKCNFHQYLAMGEAIVRPTSKPREVVMLSPSVQMRANTGTGRADLFREERAWTEQFYDFVEIGRYQVIAAARKRITLLFNSRFHADLDDFPQPEDIVHGNVCCKFNFTIIKTKLYFVNLGGQLVSYQFKGFEQSGISYIPKKKVESANANTFRLLGNILYTLKTSGVMFMSNKKKPFILFTNQPKNLFFLDFDLICYNRTFSICGQLSEDARSNELVYHYFCLKKSLLLSSISLGVIPAIRVFSFKRLPGRRAFFILRPDAFDIIGWRRSHIYIAASISTQKLALLSNSFCTADYSQITIMRAMHYSVVANTILL